jgi:hypothetical protein
MSQKIKELSWNKSKKHEVAIQLSTSPIILVKSIIHENYHLSRPWLKPYPLGGVGPRRNNRTKEIPDTW